MSSADLVIKGGRVAVSSSLRSYAIAAKDGRVTWIGSNSNAPSARRVIDASGLVVLPGVIDVHVHMRDPGATYKEDFRSGTAAAAAGGVTTIFDMPNNTPPTKDADSLRVKVRAAEEKALVDYALYGLLTIGSQRKIAPLIEAGAIGFKCYMAETTGSVSPPSEDEMREDLALVGKAGMRVSVHAEDDSVVRQRISELRKIGRVDAMAHYESRPEAAEEIAVRRAVAIAREAKCNLHIAHLSSAAGAREVRRAKRSRRRGGADVTAETCPQYLLLDKGDYAEKGSLMKANPSVKRKEDRLALWRAVREGTVDMIATDHAPHTIEEKTAGASIFDRASGFPGLETSVALMLTCVSRGLLSLSRYVRLTSAGPAQAWGLYPKKGRIALGSDADFTIVDTKREWRIDPARFVSKARYSPFEGFMAKGAAVYTIVRGRVVMDNGHIDAQSRGEMQRPL
ncbi:MAG TPA: allantoinase AllB [Nitrososphaerales archaeon]|nr:allantoinase AllB [Nitrososphaerales archaeon]